MNTATRKTKPPARPAPQPVSPQCAIHCFAPTHALSVKQPWASLIVLGLKGIENRTWRTNMRGRIAIHASSAAPLLAGFSSFLEQPAFMTDPAEIESFRQHVLQEFDPRDPENRVTSAVVGTVEIVDCLTGGAHDPATLPQDSPGYDTPPWCWADEVSHHWCFARPTAFEKPIPCSGRLNLWAMAPTIAREVSRQEAIAWVCRHDDPATCNPLDLREAYRILTGAAPQAGSVESWHEAVSRIVEPRG